MADKTNLEFQEENSELKERLSMLARNFDKLSEEYKSLQIELVIEKEKKCKKCEKSLEKERDLKKHTDKQRPPTRMFECDKCNKEFDREWKMHAHLKTHKKYECDQCDKSFDYQDIKKKHVLIVHENTKLYCHFFNNDKTCPYDERCVFLHEVSKFCRYGEMCERELCMYRHGKIQEISERMHSPSDHDNVIDVSDAISDSGDVEEETEHDLDEMNENEKTFNNPSQENKTPSENIYKYKCERCDFKAATKNDFDSHKKEVHNWCTICFSSFSSQERLKKHSIKKHKSK